MNNSENSSTNSCMKILVYVEILPVINVEFDLDVLGLNNLFQPHSKVHNHKIMVTPYVDTGEYPGCCFVATCLDAVNLVMMGSTWYMQCPI